MANQRNKPKKLVGFYASRRKKALEKLAKARGISVSELLRQLSTGTIKLFLLALLAFNLARSPKNWSAAALKQTAAAAWAKLSR